MIQTFYNAFLWHRTLASGHVKVIKQMFGHFPKIATAYAIMVFERCLVDFGIDALFRAIKVAAELESLIL